MKKVLKKYTKPEISFVDFSMSSSIAATCDNKANHYNSATCEYESPLWGIIFAGTNSVCSTQTQDGTNDMFCQHVPIAGSVIFSS